MVPTKEKVLLLENIIKYIRPKIFVISLVPIRYLAIHFHLFFLEYAQYKLINDIESL